MYPKKAFSTREQNYSALLRQKLEEAEAMVRQLNPSMERGLALNKLDECLLWANVSIAGTGISMNWRAPDVKPAQGHLASEVYSIDPGVYDYQLKIADAMQSAIRYETIYMDTAKIAEDVKAAGERIAARKAENTAHELGKLESAVAKREVNDDDGKPKDDEFQAELAEAIHDGMQCTISSEDGALSKFPELEKAARSWKTLLNYTPDVNDREEFRAWLREIVKYKKCAAAVKKFYEQWTEEKKAQEAHQNE